MARVLAALGLFGLCAALAPPGRVVVFGPGSAEMKMVSAKLMARAGFETTALAPDDQINVWKRLMFGADGGDAVALSTNVGGSLGRAQALCLICDSREMPEAQIASFLDAAPDARRVVLLSRMGASSATPGPFGLASLETKLRACEETLRAAAAARDVELSIVRAGTLKGGGPGKVENGVVVSGVEYGLAKTYYDTLFDMTQWMCTTAYDQFTLGADVSAGDSVAVSNPLLTMAAASDFSPRADETSRIVAGGALVAALRHEKPIEFSVGAAKAEAPPTVPEWESLLSSLS